LCCEADLPHPAAENSERITFSGNPKNLQP
jgi:hypothetical protein